MTKKCNADVVMICAQIEAELVSLGKEEAENYLKELGVTSSGIEKMIKSAYDILNLQTYITAGEKKFGHGLSQKVQKLLLLPVSFILILKKVLLRQKLYLMMILFRQAAGPAPEKRV